MGRVEIVEKLNNFLNRYTPFTEECHVVYLMVEARKILDRENNRKYPTLRFYCNWSVHTDKDPTQEMKAIMEDIYRAHGCVRGRIDFVKRLVSIVHYQFGNAY